MSYKGQGQAAPRPGGPAGNRPSARILRGPTAVCNLVAAARHDCVLAADPRRGNAMLAAKRTTRPPVVVIADAILW